MDYNEILEKALNNITNEDLNEIKNQFDPILTDEQINDILIKSNWEFSYDQDEEILFDCIPFDSQLRMYVYVTDRYIKNNTFKAVLSAE